MKPFVGGPSIDMKDINGLHFKISTNEKTHSFTGCLKSKNSEIILEKEKNLRQMGTVHK